MQKRYALKYRQYNNFYKDLYNEYVKLEDEIDSLKSELAQNLKEVIA